jgi:hypothetical protein
MQHLRYLPRLCGLLLIVLPMRAEAFEVAGGVSVGVIAAGTEPQFALSPHAGIPWRKDNGLLVTLHDQLNILPPSNFIGAGVYNQMHFTLGYASNTAQIRVGPSLAIYSIPACGVTLCGRVVGIAPGGHAIANFFISERWGMSLSANLDWVGGRSLVLPGGFSAMLVAGPVLRWESK